MISYKPLARSIRFAAREKMRASRSLRKTYRRIRPSIWSRFPGNARAVFLFYPALILVALLQRGDGQVPCTLIALYCAATSLLRSTQFSTALYRSGDLAFFMHVPIEDKEFFDYEWRKLLRASGRVWLYSFLTFAYTAWRANMPWIVWLSAAAAAALQWLLVVSLVVLLELLFPAWPKMKVGAPLYALTFVTLFLPAPWVPSVSGILLALPTTWVPYIFLEGVIKHNAGSLYALGPVLFMIILLPLARPRLRNAYPAGQVFYPLAMGTGPVEGQEETPSGGPEPASGETDHAVYDRERSTPLAQLRAEQFQLPAWSTSGRIECMVNRWLNQRETSVAILLSGSHPSWSARWELALKIILAGVLTTFLKQWIPPWVCIAIGVIASLVAMPLFGGAWEGLQLQWAGAGRVVATCTIFPTSYTEMSRVMAKVNVVRMASFAPLFLAYGGLLAWREGVSAMQGIQIAVELLLVLISLQPVMIAGQHARGTTDTRKLNLHTVGTFSVLALLALLYVGCTAMMFCAAEWAASALIAAGAAIGMFLCAWLAWRMYRLLYDRGRIDLIRSTD